MFEVGHEYIWYTDNVTPCFLIGDDNINSEREYAKDGFIMKYGTKDIQYHKGIITPMYKSRCKCISTSPLTFETAEISSPLIESDVEWNHREVVKKVLEDLALSDTDLAVDVITSVAVPWSHHDKIVTEDIVRNELTKYITENVGHEYHGSSNGYSDYKDTLQNVLTIVFGHRIARALMSIEEYDISAKVNDDGNGYTAFYKDVEISEFLDDVEDKLRKSNVGSVQNKFCNAANLMG